VHGGMETSLISVLYYIIIRRSLNFVMADADKHHDDYDAIQHLLSYLDPKNEAVIKARKELIRMPTFMLQVSDDNLFLH